MWKTRGNHLYIHIHIAGVQGKYIPDPAEKHESVVCRLCSEQHHESKCDRMKSRMIDCVMKFQSLNHLSCQEPSTDSDSHSGSITFTVWFIIDLVFYDEYLNNKLSYATEIRDHYTWHVSYQFLSPFSYLNSRDIWTAMMVINRRWVCFVLFSYMP